MRDVDDAGALRAQPRDDAEQAARPRVRSSDAVGSSMIRIRASAPSALAISTSCCSGMRQGLDQPRGIDRGADAREQFAARGAAARASRCAASAARTRRERDVLRDRRVREKRRLLVDRGDAERASDGWIDAAIDCRGDASEPESACSAPVTILMKRRFACAVLADQGVNFAGAELERDAVQRADAGERFCDGCRFEERARHVEDVTARPERRDASSQVDVVAFEHRLRSGPEPLEQLGDDGGLVLRVAPRPGARLDLEEIRPACGFINDRRARRTGRRETRPASGGDPSRLRVRAPA